MWIYVYVDIKIIDELMPYVELRFEVQTQFDEFRNEFEVKVGADREKVVALRDELDRLGMRTK